MQAGGLQLLIALALCSRGDFALLSHVLLCRHLHGLRGARMHDTYPAGVSALSAFAPTPPRSASVLAMPSKALSAKEKQNRAQAAFELKCEREEHAARLKSMKKDMVEARKAYSKHNTTVTSSQLDFWRLRLMGRGCSASM